MIMILYFEDSYEKRREIGRPLTEEEVYEMINNFLNEHNYKSHYIRSWVNEEEEIYYDVGSWSEFFVLKK